MSMANNRQPRIDTRLPVVETAQEGATYYTKNLSMGGLFLVTEKRWPVGSEIGLTITFGRARLPLTARVTHLQRDGVGMCFVEPSDSVREALRQLIASQIPSNDNSAFAALKSAVGLRGKQTVLSWTDGKIRHEAVVRELTMQGGFFDGPERPAVGSTIMVYVPSTLEVDRDEVQHELRGSSADVLSHTDSGFQARWAVPSAEFRMALDRLLRDLAST